MRVRLNGSQQSGGDLAAARGLSQKERKMTLNEILDTMERGLADCNTAEALRDLTDDLFECPRCHRLCESLFGPQQVCSICHIKDMTWTRRSSHEKE